MRSEQEIADDIAGMFIALQAAEIKLPRNDEEHMLGPGFPQETQDAPAFDRSIGQTLPVRATGRDAFQEARELPPLARRLELQGTSLGQVRTAAWWIWTRMRRL